MVDGAADAIVLVIIVFINVIVAAVLQWLIRVFTVFFGSSSSLRLVDAVVVHDCRRLRGMSLV